MKSLAIRTEVKCTKFAGIPVYNKLNWKYQTNALIKNEDQLLYSSNKDYFSHQRRRKYGYFLMPYRIISKITLHGLEFYSSGYVY